ASITTGAAPGEGGSSRSGGGAGDATIATTDDQDRDSWIAFLLSLAMPGAGQLWAGKLSGLLWLLAGALLIMFWGLLAENVGYYRPVTHFASFLILGVLSGEHARRLIRRRGPPQ